MARLKRKSLLHDTSGASIIEVALLGPVFFALLGAILDTSVSYLAAQVLESGVQDTSRLIRTGEVQHKNWTVADYKKDVCGRLYGLFGDCSDMYVSVRQIDNFQAADYKVPLDRNCKINCKWTKSDEWQPGVASGVVMVQVYYRYPAILQLPIASNRLGDGRILMAAATVFRNEPF